MNNVFISYFNGEITFWEYLPKAGDLPLHALLYRHEPKKFDHPLLYRVDLNSNNIPTFFHVTPSWRGVPAELKTAALLTGAPFPE